MALSVVILAAGQGKRMGTQLPKVLHCIGGIPLLQHVVQAAELLNPDRILTIYGNAGEKVRQTLSHIKTSWVLQEQQLGTGHAVMQALPQCDDKDMVLVLYGDTPLIQPTTLKQLIEFASPDQLAILVAKMEDPTGLGRIIRDKNGSIQKIREEKDASRAEKAIREINTGIIAVPARFLKKWLPELGNNNQQKEYYLTDIVEKAVSEGVSVVDLVTHDTNQAQGINDCWQLAMVERAYQKRLAKSLMLKGVRIADPARIDFRSREFVIAPDAFLDINVVIKGKTRIGAHAKIGPNVILKDAIIGEHVTIKANSVIEGAIVEEQSVVGPFARIRPGTHLKKAVKVGNFVEIKKSTLGEGTKASHLTYLGDAEIAENVNIGAGTITCNYDGVNKWQTEIARGAFVGSNVSLVAPIKVGENATIGAGSVVSRKVPASQLTVARAQSKVINGWSRPTKQEKDA